MQFIIQIFVFNENFPLKWEKTVPENLKKKIVGSVTTKILTCWKLCILFVTFCQREVGQMPRWFDQSRHGALWTHPPSTCQLGNRQLTWERCRDFCILWKVEHGVNNGGGGSSFIKFSHGLFKNWQKWQNISWITKSCINKKYTGMWVLHFWPEKLFLVRGFKKNDWMWKELRGAEGRNWCSS